MSTETSYDAIVVGGGFFGCALSVHLRSKLGLRVVVLEASPEPLLRASHANQARVHNGYHYPRSLLTALRCRVNFPRFVDDFGDCIVDDFESYYAVARTFSQVTAAQFRSFCERIGARIAKPPRTVRAVFDPDRIEDVFLVQEFAFDASKLRRMMAQRMEESGVDLRLGAEAASVREVASGVLEVSTRGRDGESRLTAPAVFNCTYARLNRLLVDSGLPRVRLKHEITEMALVEIPRVLEGRAITVMCGPFFSVMPFPSRGLHTLSHVRYTPHGEWEDAPTSAWRDPYAVLQDLEIATRFPHMIRDVSRYLPVMREARYVESIWEVKTVLPQSEIDDSRPVLYLRDHGLPGLTCLLGGKIDNIYDVLEFLSETDDVRVA